MEKFKETDLAMMINNATFVDYIDRLKLIAISLFTWKGLDEVAGRGASRFMELALYENGRACLIKDKTKGFIVLRANPSDKYNIYNLPTKIQAWSIGYTKNNIDFDDCVFVMNNELMKPTFETLHLMSYRLYETERTIDTNLIAMKTPILIEGDTKTILTLKNVYMQYSGNVPFVFGNKQFDISNKLNVLKTDAPYLIDKLELHKHEIWDECMTYLGINNANTDKKERLITDEVNSNNDLINYYLNCFYKTRKQACDLMKEKYGIDVEIELNKDVLELLNKNKNVIMNYENRGVENEQIYNYD